MTHSSPHRTGQGWTQTLPPDTHLTGRGKLLFLLKSGPSPSTASCAVTRLASGDRIVTVLKSLTWPAEDDKEEGKEEEEEKE